MIKAIIIDDENYAREIIKEYLEDHSEIEIVGDYSDGFTGLKGINEHKPDLVFLDIQMPKLTGFEMLELIDENPRVIFTTAYDQFAIKAFELNAIDYLLKPFSKERFDKALQKFTESNHGVKEKSSETSQLVYSLPENELVNRLVYKVRGEIFIISVEQITYIEAQDDYVMIYLEKEKFLKQKTMSFFENHLDPNLFVRVHRSFIVKVDCIHKIEPFEKAGSILILKDRRKIPVSRSGLNKLKKLLDI